MTSNAASPALVLTTAMVLLAGCGGGGGLSASDYRAQAGRICKDAEKRTGALTQPKSLPDLRRYVDQTLTIAQQDTDKLSSLKPPSDLKSDHDAAVKAQQSAVDKLRAVKTELAKSKPSTTALQQGLAAIRTAGTQANARFRTLKVPACAK